jgi:hypothetical protein
MLSVSRSVSSVCRRSRGPDSRYQLLGLEGLGDIVVRPGLQTCHDVDGVGLGGQHHDRHTGLGSDVPTNVHAVASGEHQIQQDEVRLRVAECSERLVAVGAPDRVEAFVPEHDGQHFGKRGVVIDNQHPTASARTLARV